eukprot:SAG31_NODE_1_length_62978_cov_30.836130_11_plen_392_part_00
MIQSGICSELWCLCTCRGYIAHKRLFEAVGPQEYDWQILYKSMVMFAAIEGRVRFGHLGWSSPQIAFSRADLRISLLHWVEFGVGRYHKFVTMDPGTTSRSRATAKESAKCGSVLLETFVNVLARFVYGGLVDNEFDLSRLRTALLQCFGFGQRMDPIAMPPIDPHLHDGLNAVWRKLSEFRRKDQVSSYTQDDALPCSLYPLPVGTSTYADNMAFIRNELPAEHSCALYALPPCVDVIVKTLDAKMLRSNILTALTTGLRRVVPRTEVLDKDRVHRAVATISDKLFLLPVRCQRSTVASESDNSSTAETGDVSEIVRQSPDRTETVRLPGKMDSNSQAVTVPATSELMDAALAAKAAAEAELLALDPDEIAKLKTCVACHFCGNFLIFLP